MQLLLQLSHGLTLSLMLPLIASLLDCIEAIADGMELRAQRV
jgi:hypothetical protein